MKITEYLSEKDKEKMKDDESRRDMFIVYLFFSIWVIVGLVLLMSSLLS